LPFIQERQHALRDEIGSLQVDFDRAPPAAAVGNGDRPDLTESARTVDQHVYGLVLAASAATKISHLSIVRDVAHKSLNPRKMVGNACQTIGTPGADEDTMTFACLAPAPDALQCRSCRRYYDPKRALAVNGFALCCPTTFELGNSDFVGALACGGPPYGLQPK